MAPPKDVDPRKLKRERAGRYVTADGRFAVEGESAGSWYLTDTTRENELGLPLLEGPFATLDDARGRIAAIASMITSAATSVATADAGGAPDEPAAAEAATTAEEASLSPPPAIPEPAASPGTARAQPTPRTEAAPLSQPSPRPRPPSGSPDRPTRSAAAAPVPDEPRQPAWLDRLAPLDRATAHRLLAVLARLGIDDPALVRREVEGNVPEVARLLLARRVREEALDPWRDHDWLAAEIKEIPTRVRRHLRGPVDSAVEAAGRLLDRPDAADGAVALAWLVALRTAVNVLAALDAERRDSKVRDEPGWRLLELDSRQAPTDRSITLDGSDLLEP